MKPIYVLHSIYKATIDNALEVYIVDVSLLFKRLMNETLNSI